MGMDKKAYGTRVRQLREDQALSQSELALAADTTPNTIGRIERGEVFPRPKTQRAIAEALEVSPRFLKRGESDG
jgi:transcriptional regulator with XRE-family HTH domain